MAKKIKTAISAPVLIIGLVVLVSLTILGKSVISGYSKSRLLKSSNIDEVTKGVALNYIPQGEIKITNNSVGYKLDGVFIELSSQQYKKLSNSLSSAVNHNSTGDEITFDNKEWNTFPYTEVSDILTKNGYGCIWVKPNVLYQSGGNNLAHLYCANIANLENNTPENIEAFMLGELTAAGIDCKKEGCKIEKIESKFPTSYGRKVWHSDKTIKLSKEEMVKMANTEAERAAVELAAAGYTVQNIDDTDHQKNGGFDNTVVSRLVMATNENLSCIHGIRYRASREIVKTYDFDKFEQIECEYTIQGLKNLQEN